MTELILSIVFMYLVVGSCAYWSLRKRRQLHEESLTSDPYTSPTK